VSISLKGTLVLLGAGKMGGAMLEGWLRGGVPPNQIVVLDPSPPDDIVAVLEKNAIRSNPSLDAVQDVEVLVAAVKPQIMDSVLTLVSVLKRDKPLVLSIAAGKTIRSFEQHFGEGASIVRTIPNTPAAIGRGITVMTCNAQVTDIQAALATQLLATLGEVVMVDDESLIDAATAVSGSGPAYLFHFVECLAQAAEAVGLAPDIAMQLARATVSGSAALMQATGIDAAQLRKNVTSPKGTTHAALEVLMDHDGLERLMVKAVKAAASRSRELAQ
jgi:pyrroline-5-carboxylate reductase